MASRCAGRGHPGRRGARAAHSLIDKSLVVLDGEAAGDARYRLLDTIREYAAERLEAAGEKDALALRHRDCILALVEETVKGMFRRGEPPWPVRLAVFRRGIAEYGNFRIALATSLAHEHADEGLRVHRAAQHLAAARRRPRGGPLARPVPRFPPGSSGGRGEVSPQVRGRALACRAEIAFDLQDYDTLMRCATESLELARASGDDFPVPTALRVISQAAARAGVGDAVAYIEEAIAAAEAAGNDWEAGLPRPPRRPSRSGRASSSRPSAPTRAGGAGRQHPLGGRSGRIRDGHPGQDPRRRGGGGQVLRRRQEIFRELDARLEIARCQAGIGWIAVTSGDFDQAQESLAEALRLNQIGGQRLGIARGLEAFAALAAARRQPERAARLAGAACQLRESLGHGTGIGPRIEEVLEFARSRPARRPPRLVRRGTRGDRRRRRWLRARPGPGPARAGTPGGRRAAWTDPARLGGGAHRGSAPSSHSTPLTPREHEIVRLIAQGLSNREIAHELVISPATAPGTWPTSWANSASPRVHKLPHGPLATSRPADLACTCARRAGS